MELLAQSLPDGLGLLHDQLAGFQDATDDLGLLFARERRSHPAEEEGQVPVGQQNQPEKCLGFPACGCAYRATFLILQKNSRNMKRILMRKTEWKRCLLLAAFVTGCGSVGEQVELSESQKV